MDELVSVPLCCPYCGQEIEILVDGSVPQQRYIEDCHVCCRAISLTISLPPLGVPQVEARQESE